MNGINENSGRIILAAALCLLVVNGALIAGYFVRRKKTGQPLLARRWSVADLWFGIQAIVVLLILFSLPILFVALAQGITLDEMTRFNTARSLLYVALPSVIIQDALLFLVPAACINLRYHLPLRAIGLPAKPRRRDVFAGIVLGLVAMGLSGLIGSGAEGIAAHFHHVAWVRDAIYKDNHNPIAEATKMIPRFGVIGLLLMILGAGVAAPWGEEMLFRGFVFNALKRRLGLWPGIIISALLFALPHSYGLGLIPVFALGMVLAWTYHNSGSLWVTILMHATNNTVQVVLAFYLPSLIR